MPSINVSNQERHDIIEALREKAKVDRAAADPLLGDENTGRQHMAKTLILQAERQERLANRLEF